MNGTHFQNKQICLAQFPTKVKLEQNERKIEKERGANVTLYVRSGKVSRSNDLKFCQSRREVSNSVRHFVETVEMQHVVVSPAVLATIPHLEISLLLQYDPLLVGSVQGVCVCVCGWVWYLVGVENCDTVAVSLVHPTDLRPSHIQQTWCT